MHQRTVKTVGKKKKPNSQGSMGTGREEQTHQAQRAMIHSEHNEEMKNEKRSTQNVIIHSIREMLA